MRVEYSAAAVAGPEHQKKIEAAQRFCDKLNWTFGIQIHCSTGSETTEIIRQTAIPLSFHAPVNSEYFMNLAARDASPAKKSFEKSAEIISKHNAKLAVFHGFLMTDAPITAFNAEKSYEECMTAAYRKDISQKGSTFCCDFFETDEFKMRLERVKERLPQFQQEFDDIDWQIENDYPAFGAGLTQAEHIVSLNMPFCVDVSHCWASTILYKKDFLEQISIMAQSRRIGCVHLHASSVPPGAPAKKITDGHLSLASPNAMRLDKVVKILAKNGAEHFVIETSQADLLDLQLLADWLG